jgi:Holliday junction resolvase
MVNKEYVKGRNKEYKIRNQLINEGFYIVQRTAGSHSPIDIIAIDKNIRVIKLIQVKPDSLSENQKIKIESEMNWLNNVFRVEFRVL